MKLIYFLSLFMFLSTNAFALGEPTGNRTWKVETYDKDSRRDRNQTHKFGIFEEQSVYEDPVFSDAYGYSSPLHDSRYQTYDIVVVVNMNNEKPTAENAGRKLEVAQRMRVYVRPEAMEKIGWDRFHLANPYDPDSGLLYHWKTSTALAPKETPKGHFGIRYFSSNNISSISGGPMPWSVFFSGTLYAVHGTTATGKLGVHASNGCIRIETQRARDLFHLVGAAGLGDIDFIDTDGVIKFIGVDGKIRALKEGDMPHFGYKTLVIVK